MTNMRFKNLLGRPGLWEILAGVAVVGLVAAALQVHQQTGKQSSHESPESGKQTETQLRDFKHEVTVLVTDSGPSPQTLNIPADTRISFENKDSVAHQLAITPGTTVPPLFDNFHQISVGGGYPYVVHQAVTFHYYLVDRPTQGGVVIVK